MQELNPAVLQAEFPIKLKASPSNLYIMDGEIGFSGAEFTSFGEKFDNI